MMFNQPGWNQSAEDAWLTPPDVWDEPETTRRDLTVKQALKIMERKNKRMNLYEISSEYAEFIEAFDNGDIPDDAFADTLDGIHGLFEEKCVSVACSIKNDNAMIEALNAEIGRLTERKNAMTRKVESKKGYLMRSMQAVGVDKLKDDPRAHITIKKNPPKVVFSDKADFLARAKENGWMYFLNVPQPEVNVNAVKSALTNGKTIPGVYLEQGKRVDIG